MKKQIKHQLKKIYYLGSSYKCPYCNSNLRKLHPHGLSLPVLFELNVIGGKRRENNRCPICVSNDRERLLFFYHQNVMSGHIKKTGKARVLHIAPENNFGKLLRSNNNIEYISGDKFEKGYEGAYEASFMDICDTKLPEASLDYVICNHVLEHVDSYQRAMAEIKRILKPGGKAVLQVPIAGNLKTTIEDTGITSKEEREARFGQYDHVRLFGQDYAKLLEQAGFTVRQFTSAELSKNNVRKHALNPEEILYEVTK